MLYEGFGEDHSSFGMLTYAESRPRKEVLLPLFSRRAILTMQSLVREKVGHPIIEICDSRLTLPGRPFCEHSSEE